MQNNSRNNCPLCNNEGVIFYQKNKHLHYQCGHCLGIFSDKKLRLDREDEILRYTKHNNDVEDKKYQEFVSPITSAIQRDFSLHHIGLDFGAGTGPVISKILTDNGYHIIPYDPFFHNYPGVLKEEQYDYIACCEVIEHFFDPQKEFSLLKKLLRTNGKLYCMTDMYKETINFHEWYYKNDPTHVFFYHQKTIQWIKEEWGFLGVNIEGRLITFFN